MARVNVYLPDDLAEQVRRENLNVSAIAQGALRSELAAASASAWLAALAGLPPLEVPESAVLRALDDAREELGFA